MYKNILFFKNLTALLLLATLLLGTVNAIENGPWNTMRILALFSETTNELGLDHRLGRQVLKLAVDKAKLLYPTIGVELVIYSDDTECSSSSNIIPIRVTEEYYLPSGRLLCDNNITCQANVDTSDLDSYLNDPPTNPTDDGLWHGSHVDAIIGPSCEYLVDLVSRMAAYWRTPIYSVASIGSQFGRKDIYSSLTRLSPSLDHLSMLLVNIMGRYKWRHLAIILVDKQIENWTFLDNLERTITRVRFMVPIDQKLFMLNTPIEEKKQNVTGEHDFCTTEVRDTLTAARKVARIFLLLINDQQQVRHLMLCAYQLSMDNGEFVFMVVNMGLKSAGQLSETNRGSGNQQNLYWYLNNDDDNNQIAKKMYESVMILSVEVPIGEEYTLFVEKTLELAHKQYPGARFEQTSVGPLATSLHDSLLLAVEAYVRQLNNTKEATTEKVDIWDSHDDVQSRPWRNELALMWNESYFHGLIAGIHINSNGDQELDYMLSDMEPDTGHMRPVAKYSREKRQLELSSDGYIHWPKRQNAYTKEWITNDVPPLDEPECGFNNDADHCVDRQNMYAALTIVGVIALLAIITISVSLYNYRKIKYQMQLDDFWWRVNWDDLQFIKNSGSITSGPRSIVQTLRSGGSVISAGSDGGHSLVSVVKQKDLNSMARQKANQLGPEMSKRVNGQRKSAVSVVVTSEDEKNATTSEVASRTGSIEPESAITSSFLLKSEFSSVVQASNLALYNKKLVIVKQLNASNIEVNKDLLVELRSMREHINENLASFVGLCVESKRVAILYEYCSRGSLQDMLLNESIAMDWTLKYSIIGDLIRGLGFIHTTLLDYHGRLKSTNLVLDSRFTIKITDFGLQSLYSQIEPIGDRDSDNDDFDDNVDARSYRSKRSLKAESQSCYNMDSVSAIGAKTKRAIKLSNKGGARYFWTAPEHLRATNPHCSGSKKGDVYSLAIILCELFTRKEPYHYGSNVKPDWPLIRRDKKLFEQQTRTSSGANLRDRLSSRAGLDSEMSGTNRTRADSRADIKSDVSGMQKTSLVGKLGNQIRHKRSSVAPIESDLASVTSESSHKRRASKLGSLVEEDGNEERRDEMSALNPHAIIGKRSHKDVDEILDQLRMSLEPEPVRPYVPNWLLTDVNPKLVDLMRVCWSESPAARPNLDKIRNSMKNITKGVASRNYLDNLLDRLQSYAANLEQIVDSKSADIIEEKQRTEEILYQLVPRFVAEKLKNNQTIVPQVYDGVTIFFSDLIGFEKYTSILSPSELVDLLNGIYSSFDSIINSFDVTKIETIIDLFLVASGMSLGQDQPQTVVAAASEPIKQTEIQETEEQNESEEPESGKKIAKKLLKSLRRARKPPGELGTLDNGGGGELKEAPERITHYSRSSAEQVARMALCIRDLMKSFHFGGQTSDGNSSKLANMVFNIRIGIHSGKVCAGLVGAKRPKFCLIGDTVNVASRMHTNSKANRIQISLSTKQLLDQVPGFNIEPRGSIEVKGKGMMETYWLDSSY